MLETKVNGESAPHDRIITPAGMRTAVAVTVADGAVVSVIYRR